jgi:glucan phosphoethanolaminetransferase (alkaline phosphatase superfamily)
MIQRIQTIFLFLTAALLVGLLFVPIWENQEMKDGTLLGKLVLDAFKLKFETLTNNAGSSITRMLIPDKNVIYIGVLALSAALSALFSITRYQNRILQLKLGMLTSLLVSALLGSIFLAIKQGNDLLNTSNKGQYLIGFFLPIGALIFNMLANRFIKKDENLVRSVDRLR